MFKCNTCSHAEEVPFSRCPVCGSVPDITDGQIRDYLYIIYKAQKDKKYEVAVSGYRALAELGHTPSELEYAKILEKGELVPQNLDTAMLYYYRAACKNDPLGAYRYSRLLSRTSEAGARFWLLYSAYLGCAEAYPEAARLYSLEGDEAAANYYYSLSYETDTAACLTLAKRYFEGVGTEPSPANAKYFISKFKLLPISAWGMAWKLRSVKPEAPNIGKPESAMSLPHELAGLAKEYKYLGAYFNIISALAEDSTEHLTTLGILYAEGIGCEKAPDAAVKALKRAASQGSIKAYRYLGDMFLEGKLVTRDAEAAIECYTAMARLGDNKGYELIGDIYYDGAHERCDLAEAIKFYELAAKSGNTSAYSKSERLKDEREEFFLKAEQIIDTDPCGAFKAFAISAGMGYSPAFVRLGKCYRFGIGTKRDGKRAFMWYEHAHKAGDEGALFELGLCYARGIGTAFDYKRATGYLRSAARGGDKRAEDELIRLMENKKRYMAASVFSRGMRLLYQKRFELAKAMLDAGAEAGNPKATYTLGCMYEFGLGTATNRELAFALYEKAYAMKFRDPRQTYKLKVLKMIR